MRLISKKRKSLQNETLDGMIEKLEEGLMINSSDRNLRIPCLPFCYGG